ncbi:MAG: glycosyltransferase family 4 protein [Siphonobacter sp.]
MLYIHNFYHHKGGEESVLEQEKELLKEDVNTRLFSSENNTGIKGALQFLASIWNFRSSSRLKKEIVEFAPDVIHIHNWHFATGPIIIRTAKNHNIPVVLTLHNYRIICPSATFLINGKISTNSITAKFPWFAIKSKAYRDSYFQTFWLAFVVWFHKIAGTWKKVDKYIVLTDFSRELFLKSTLELTTAQFSVKPNFVMDKGFSIHNRGAHFLFVGRLSPEKGIDVLLNAFIKSRFPVRIIGDGPMKNHILDVVHKHHNIEYLGSMPNDKIREEMRQASALVFPSIWYEGMPMTLVEAFSTGTPVLASNLGAMMSMIENNFNGMLFESSNVDDLIKHLQHWNCIPLNQKNDFSLNSRLTYEQLYTPKANREKLLSIYKDVMAKSS